MQNAKAQFISIFIMAALSVTIVTGLDSIWKTIEDNTNIMYAATNISDMWVYVSNPTEKQMWSISRIQGVEHAEKRFTLNAKSDQLGLNTEGLHFPAKRWIAHPSAGSMRSKVVLYSMKLCKQAWTRH